MSLDVAVTHLLPTGGAMRVLAEWAKNTRANRVTIYTANTAAHDFAPVGSGVRIVRTDEPFGTTGLGTVRALATAPRVGRRVAATVDAGGHDVVFAFASQLTQAPSVLRYLRTPTLYYAPEQLRTAYEPRDLVWGGPGILNTLTRHGFNPVEDLRRRRDRQAIAAADNIVTHSTFTQRTLEEVYGVASRVVRLGVDSDAFVPTGRPPADPAYVLSVGALTPFKGHGLVIDAVARMNTPRPRLVLIGDRGDDGPALAAQAASLGVDLDIRGGIPFTEVVGLYQGASAVVCAQVREPFGLVPLEGMAAGRPVVAVAEGGLLETVRDGVTGLTVARDPEDVARALDRLAADPDLRTSLSEAGRRTAETEWTWGAYAQAIDGLLAEVAGGGTTS